MEATQKRGFFKGKLAKSLSRVTKRISHHHQQQYGGSGSGSGSGSSKVGPYPPSISNDDFDSAGGRNLANCSSMPRVLLSTYSYASYKHPSTFHEQKSVADIASSMQKVSFANDQNWGYGDENVDIKATSYISIVRERFKLDRVDSTGNQVPGNAVEIS